MKKAKLRAFAEWLREQPDTGFAFAWRSPYKCVSAYAHAWANQYILPLNDSVGEDPLIDIFNMPPKKAKELYVGGARTWTKHGDKKLAHAKLRKVADVIDYISYGHSVDSALVAVFGEKSFRVDKSGKPDLTPMAGRGVWSY